MSIVNYAIGAVVLAIIAIMFKYPRILFAYNTLSEDEKVSKTTFVVRLVSIFCVCLLAYAFAVKIVPDEYVTLCHAMAVCAFAALAIVFVRNRYKESKKANYISLAVAGVIGWLVFFWIMSSYGII